MLASCWLACLLEDCFRRRRMRLCHAVMEMVIELDAELVIELDMMVQVHSVEMRVPRVRAVLENLVLSSE